MQNGNAWFINECARGATLSASHEQVANTHTFAAYELDSAHTPACMYWHTFALSDKHTRTSRLLAYLLSKQCLLGSPHLTLALQQSIKPALWDPVKLRYLQWSLKSVALLLLNGSHCAGDVRFLDECHIQQKKSGFNWSLWHQVMFSPMCL